jgi:hypothetical protein
MERAIAVGSPPVETPVGCIWNASFREGKPPVVNTVVNDMVNEVVNDGKK